MSSLTPFALQYKPEPILDHSPFLDENNPFLDPPSTPWGHQPFSQPEAMTNELPPFSTSDHPPFSPVSTGFSRPRRPARPRRFSRISTGSIPSNDPVEPPILRQKRVRPTSQTAVVVQMAVKVEKTERDVKQETTTIGISAGTSAGPPKERRSRATKTMQAGTVKTEAGAEAISVKQEVIEAGSSCVRALALLEDRISVRCGTEIKPDSPQLVQGSSDRGGHVVERSIGKGKEKAKVTTPAKESRPARIRNQCPKTTMDRGMGPESPYLDAQTDGESSQACEVSANGEEWSHLLVIANQPIMQFLLDRQRLDTSQTENFKVLGSTGNVYTIDIGCHPRCDCPDYMKGNSPCKHIIFVFLKVLKVSEASTIWYQKGLTPAELREMYESAPPMAAGSVTVSTKIKNAFLKASGLGGDLEELTEDVEKDAEAVGPGGKRLDAVGEDCPVCYDEMTEEDHASAKLVFDEALAGCGRPLHKNCFAMWTATTVKQGNAVSCVWCRTPWPVPNPTKVATTGGVAFSGSGYMNMAELVGISQERDTSSYYWGPMRGRRMTDPRYQDD